MEPVKFKLNRFGIELSGSEEFVINQIENFKPDIKSFFESLNAYPALKEHQKYLHEPITKKQIINNPKIEVSSVNSMIAEEAEFTEVKNTEMINYDNVIIIDNGQIRIIVDIPGQTLAKRMINVILLYLWAKLLLGVETANFSELREVCTFYGEIDSSNFAKHLDTNKKFFLITGDQRSKTVKLIRPGIKEAERIIIQLNQK